jgi:hypothetical protein
MEDPLQAEADLVAALKLTALPPHGWIQAAELIPSTLGDLETIERAVSSEEFRRHFASDPHGAVEQAGLDPSQHLVDALQDRFG